jgi:hypothetical protein
MSKLSTLSRDETCYGIGESEVKSVPTQRAADGGYAPRFLSIFLALSLFRFEGESTLPPTAANASRWAAKSFVKVKGKDV